ncbi:MAG: DUF4129 domain-containing protein, partial [Actinomycetota bacterium]|nr:DUF4129 domain-containing protein [Actinomycetota bacterium]
ASPPPSASTGDPDTGTGTGTRIGLTVAGLLVFTGLAGLTPMVVREGRRRRRLHLVGVGGPQAVSAAWEEVLAESADRGVVPPVGETVRAVAARLAHEHDLDESGRTGLRTVVSAVERAWYASVPDAGRSDTGLHETDRELYDAVEAVRASMARSAPLTRTARLLPRSVLPWLPDQWLRPGCSQPPELNNGAVHCTPDSSAAEFGNVKAAREPEGELRETP